MKRILLLLIYFTTPLIHANDYGELSVDWILGSSELFRLSVTPVNESEKIVEFIVLKGVDDAYLLIDKGETYGALYLEQSKLVEMNSYLENALEFNLHDTFYAFGKISEWCLKRNNSSTKITVCFWSPGINTEKRKLTGMYNLGSYLSTLESLITIWHNKQRNSDSDAMAPSQVR